MTSASADRIQHIVGLAGAPRDGHVRVTRGDCFRVWMGSEATHAAMQAWCEHILQSLAAEGLSLESLSEEEFLAFVSRLNGPSTS